MQPKHAIGVFFVICSGAKTKGLERSIFGDMNANTLDLELTVDKILQRWPQAFSVFMKNKTKCVGCFMQPFCTLQDVADTYQLSLEQLIDEIKNTPNVPPGGATMGEFSLEVPGRYILVDHELARLQRGLAGFVTAEGPESSEIYHGTPTDGSGH